MNLRQRAVRRLSLSGVVETLEYKLFYPPISKLYILVTFLDNRQTEKRSKNGLPIDICKSLSAIYCFVGRIENCPQKQNVYIKKAGVCLPLEYSVLLD